MLASRILTAALLLGGFLAALFLLARWQFAIVVGLVVVVAAHEWAGLCGLGQRRKQAYAAMACIAYAALAVAWLNGTSMVWLFGIATVFWGIAVPAWVHRGFDHPAAGKWLVPVGFVVIVPAGTAMLALSPRILLAVLALTWIADTAAYFTGRAWGRRKLAPRISPGKTQEGAAGALVAVAIYAIICATLLPELAPLTRGAGWAILLAGAFVLAVMSILGDLFESAIKRRAGAKDSGTLLPGHGGVLDRIDSATSTLPLAALLFHWMLTP
ncbi:MAG: phosphatidate cytidylyltransferase [Burkholderiales bacterium]